MSEARFSWKQALVTAVLALIVAVAGAAFGVTTAEVRGSLKAIGSAIAAGVSWSIALTVPAWLFVIVAAALVLVGVAWLNLQSERVDEEDVEVAIEKLNQTLKPSELTVLRAIWMMNGNSLDRNDFEIRLRTSHWAVDSILDRLVLKNLVVQLDDRSRAVVLSRLGRELMIRRGEEHPPSRYDRV